MLTQEKLPDITSRKTHFEYAYQLIKQRNLKDPHTIVTACDTHMYHYKYNPIVLLAKEMDEPAIEFLKESKIFPEYMLFKYMAQGYGMSGQIDKIIALRNEPGFVTDYLTPWHTGDSISDYAAFGCAVNGNEEQVNTLLKEGAGLEHVMTAFAVGGHSDLIKSHLARAGDDVNQSENICLATVKGYALAGHEQLLFDFIGDELFIRNCRVSQNSVELRVELAAHWSAFAGNVELTNKLMIRSTNNKQKPYIPLILNKYKESKYLDYREDALYILTMTDDVTLKESISDYIYGRDLQSEDSFVMGLMKEVAWQKFNFNYPATPAALRTFIDRYDLSYRQAKALRTKGARAWLLQGPHWNQLMIDEQRKKSVEASQKLESDSKARVLGWDPNLFWKITAEHVLDLPLADAKVLLKAVHDYLFKSIEAELTAKNMKSNSENSNKETGNALTELWSVVTSNASTMAKVGWLCSSREEIQQGVNEAKHRMEQRLSKLNLS